MKTRARFGRFIFIAVLGVLFASPLFAQFRSSIEGAVTDPSGAVVPDAKVTLTNVDTGVSQSVQSNAEGLYRFPSLPPGNYKLTATKVGFATITQENIVLLAEESRTVPLGLKAGEVKETVTITAEAAPIQYAEAKLEGDISAQEITQLPLAGRNVGSLISQTPGVTGVANAQRNASDTDIFSLVNNPQVNANGQRAEGNAFYLDNTLATSNPDPGVFNLTPNPDSIQEVHVAVNDYSSEYGRQGSLVIQAITKGGTNQFHGSLFEYHQDNKLTAHNFFDSSVPVYRRNEFGGSVGGPILKNRIFGFFSYDQKKASSPVVFQDNVETPAFVNFMKTNYPNNLATKLLTTYPAAVNGVVPGSLVTVQQLDPNCASTPPIAGIPCGMAVIETTNESFAGRDNGLQWNLRVDVNFSKDRFYGSFYRKTPDVQGINTRPAFDNPNNFAGITNYGNLDWTHTFSPSLVNDAAVGITRISGLGSCVNCNVPPINGMGIAGFGNGFSPAEFIQNDFEWRDVLSLNHGKHAWKAGFDIFRDQENDLFDGPTQRPGYGFSDTNAPTFVPALFNFANDKPTTEGAINFDLKTGALSQQSIGYRSSAFGFFGQDDWKLKSNLSLNLGLRWDFNSNPFEEAGRMSEVILGSGSTLMQKISNASVGLVPNLIRNHKIGYFAPRVSFAWDPTKQGKISIRGGLGVFFERMPNIFWSDAVRGNPPLIASVTADATVPSGPQPVYGLCANDHTPFNCPIPPPSQLPTGTNARGGSIACCSSIGGVDPDVKQAYTISRFLGVQYSLTSSWLLEADYTGSLSVHQYVRTERNRCVGCFNPVTGSATGFRPNSFFRGISYGDNSGWATFNGATFSILHRFSRSFTFQSAFTIGKTNSVVDAPGPGRDSLLAPVYNPYDINAQAGPASFDIPRAFTMHGLWELPKLSSQNAAVRGILGSWQFSGTTSLQAGYPYTVVDCSHSPTGNGGSCVLVNVTAAMKGHGCDRSGWVNGCLQASGFSDPCALNANNLLSCGSGAWEGNVGRNSFRGPGFADVDTALSKYFHIPWFVGHEGAKLQVRGEFFNFFNRVNLNSVNSNLAFNSLGGSTNPNFGKAQDAYSPRTLELALRIEF